MTISPPPISPEADDWTDCLLANGYCIIPDLMNARDIQTLDEALAPVFEATPFCEGGFYGGRTKRFGRLLSQNAMVADLVMHPLILGIVERVLGPYCDSFQLNLTQAIEIHPGELPQVPHRDQDMWSGEKGRIEYLVNVMWPLTAFRADNGATMIWPGTHRTQAQDAMPDTPAVAAECDPGSAILFLGSTLHHGGANQTASPRRGIVTGYSLGWLKTYENQFLAYPPAVARHFSPELAALVGYRQHRPNLGNYEGQCPSVLLQDHVPAHLGAIDALREDQVEMISTYHAGLCIAPTAPPAPVRNTQAP